MSNLTVLDGVHELPFFIIGVLTIPVSIVGTFSSLVTFYLILRYPQHRTTATNALILNLCLTTFLLCGITSFYDAFTMITGYPGATPDSVVCVTFAFLHFLLLSVSAHSHASIAMHRLIAVVISQNISNGRTLAVVLVSVTWLVPLLVLIFPLFHVGGEYGFSSVASRCSVVQVCSYAYAMVLKLMNSFLPLLVMMVCYVAIFWKIINSRSRLNVFDSAMISQGARGTKLLRQKAEFRITRILFLTCLWFIVCYIPSSIYGLVATKVSDLQSALAQCLILLTWIGCATTPCLYSLLSTELRSAARQECMRLLRRRSNLIAVVPSNQGRKTPIFSMFAAEI